VPPTMESFYDNNGNLESNKVMALARPYVYATCGVPLLSNFNIFTSVFHYRYQAYPSCGGVWTEMFLSETFYYPNGFTTNVVGCQNCTFQKYNTSYYAFVHSSEVQGQNFIIDIYVSPNSTSYDGEAKFGIVE